MAEAWSVEAIAGDREHGSAFLSIRALETLRDHARSDVSWEELSALARSLVRARPSMAALVNRIHRSMNAAGGDPGLVASEAEEVIERSLRADRAAAERAAVLVSGKRVMTLSRSGTVTDALVAARAERVVIAESRPGLEGVGVAETLERAGVATALIPDAAMGVVLVSADIDVVLVGADTVLPSGAVVNKIGTRLLALAASADEVPVYTVCSEDKVSANDVVELEETATPEVPLFEVTPPALVTGIVTENGVLPPATIHPIAERHRQDAAWMGPP